MRLRKKQITSQTAKHTPQKKATSFLASNQEADEESSVIFGGGGASPYPAQTFSSPLKCTRNSVQYLENTLQNSSQKKISQTSVKKGGLKQLDAMSSPLQRKNSKLVNASSPSLPENAPRRASSRHTSNMSVNRPKTFDINQMENGSNAQYMSGLITA